MKSRCDNILKKAHEVMLINPMFFNCNFAATLILCGFIKDLVLIIKDCRLLK